MRIISMDLDSIVLFLSDMDFSLEENVDKTEDKFRDIFLNLKNLYNMDIEGYYGIDIYKNKFYGMVVLIEKEDIDYFDYFDNQIDMRISIHNDHLILYELDDYFVLPSSLLDKMKLYFYHNRIYGELTDFISKLDGAYLQEYSTSIIYDSVTRCITQKNNNIEKN